MRRYNSRHEHTNKIEGVTFDDFHIHEATERYQLLGAKKDSYARPTDKFSDLDGALRCMLEDCGFEIQEGPIGDLFKERI